MANIKIEYRTVMIENIKITGERDNSLRKEKGLRKMRGIKKKC
jgi:hypothetical protein